MKLRIIALIFLLVAIGFSSEIQKSPLINKNDPVFGYDKFKHLTSSMFLVISGFYFQNRYFDKPETVSSAYSAGLTFSLGIGKECYDKYSKKTFFSWKDLLADTAGIGLGLLIIQGVK